MDGAEWNFRMPQGDEDLARRKRVDNQAASSIFMQASRVGVGFVRQADPARLLYALL